MSTRRKPRYSGARRRAISAGCRRSERSKRVHDCYLTAVRVLVRMGFAGLLSTPICEAELARTLAAIAPGKSPASTEGAALARVVALAPRTFARWLRRNRDSVRIAGPKQ